MAIVELHRVFNSPTYCIGRLLVDGVKFCDTLEDTVRDANHNGKFDNGEVKQAGVTAIPCGCYNVTFEPTTCGVGKYAKGGKIPLLHDVPSFSSIRIHSGNTAEDSRGCILLGVNDNKGRVSDSIKTCIAFFERVGYEPFALTIIDDFA